VTAGVSLVAVGVLSFNAGATFTAQASPTHATTVGDMTLTLGSAGDSHSIGLGSTDIVPGDTILRTVQITVDNGDDTMAGLTLSADCNGACTGSQTFVSDASLGLKLWIERCDQPYDVNPAWDGSTIPTSAACNGTAEDVLGTSASPVAFVQSDTDIISGMDITDDAVNYLKVRITWPTGAAGAHDAMKAQSATLRLTFTGTQRAGTDK
jgi:hypothetical protein